MELDLERIARREKYTIGELSIEGKFICHTLEDKVRVLHSFEDKIFSETAIPFGRYKVILSYSPKFKRVLPELLNVQFFNAIRMHSGNKAEDSQGCVLVGECRNIEEGYIYNSRKTEDKLMKILKPVFDSGEEIFINIH